MTVVLVTPMLMGMGHLLMLMLRLFHGSTLLCFVQLLSENALHAKWEFFRQVHMGNLLHYASVRLFYFN